MPHLQLTELNVNTHIDLYELGLYREIPVTIENTMLMILSREW